jgi:hypothetical protein
MEAEVHTAKSKDKKFRINRKKVGLTWSCPVDAETNPIESKDEVIELLASKGTLKKYTVAAEDHENGKKHYHAFVEYDDAINQVGETAVRFFDLKGVHPNLIAGAPGKGWEGYCVKHGDYVSNYWKVDVFQTVWKKRTWAEARDLLRDKMPKFLLHQGHLAERNFKRYKAGEPERGPTLYAGPYKRWWKNFMAQHDWSKTMVLRGPPGINKTQFLKYYAAHDGGCFYAKGKIKDQLREAENQDYKYLILDDASKLLNELDADDQNSILDVENGGSIQAKYKDVVVPPSRRIFIANHKVEWKIQAAPELRRRFVTYDLYVEKRVC